MGGGGEEGVIDEEGKEMEGATMEEKGRIAEVSIKGESGVEGFIDGIGGRGGRGEEEREEGWVSGEEEMKVKGATMDGEGSWMGFEKKVDEKEKGVRRKGRGKDMDCWQEGMEMEKAVMEGDGSWASLDEEDEEEKFVRRKGRRGEEGCW